MLIRPATPEDFPPLLALTHRAMRELASGAYPIEEINEAIETGVWTLPRDLVMNDPYFVAEKDGEVLGGIGWNTTWLGETETPIAHRHDLAALRSMFVSPDAAGRGVGSVLMQHCLADIRAAGLPGVEIYASFNAERLYARFGFEPLALQAVELPSGRRMLGRRMRLLFTED